MTVIEKFLLALDQQIQEKHLLTHTFYKAWSDGKLTKTCLKEYAQEYYFHVLAFPTYLSALHAHTEDLDTRREILQNLIEEEAGNPNHPELWKEFAMSLGATEDELMNYKPCKEIQALIHTFRLTCRDGSVADGLASLYAYESQIPAISTSKIDGLKNHYGLSHSSSWKYFSVHIVADVEHANVERKLLAKHITPDQIKAAHSAAGSILDAMWSFLTHMCHRYDIKCEAA
jgi:pyrroloquinoline-quinone synthase